ncbi:SIMPL domain-containing protein [Microbacterium sp. A82]|uniref:SIMPL domain-containing protein n=1 Tax=Microbacterium sp. A82 TaxID=3450452 RepID=UPI003F2EDB76
MTAVIITVRGENETRVAPERARIRVSVHHEGPDRATVVDKALSLAEPVRSSISERADSGVVAEWSSKRLAVRADRPWNNEGKQLALVYHATVDFTATFVEASELSIWVSEISSWESVDVGNVDWHLTPETRARIEREVAATAVSVAVSRAQAYAGALNLSTVVPLEIADVGLISRDQSPAAPQMLRARGAAFSVMQESSPVMAYEPDDIVIEATVEGRFSAS